MKQEIYDRLIKEHSNMIDKTYQQEIFKRWSDNLNEYEYNYRLDRAPWPDRHTSYELDPDTLRKIMDTIQTTKTVQRTAPAKPLPETREDMEEDDDVSPILAEMINDQ